MDYSIHRHPFGRNLLMISGLLLLIPLIIIKSPLFAAETVSRTDSISRPQLFVEIGGETFYSFQAGNNNLYGGLAAIMIDMELLVNRQFTLFSAFHFDSDKWHALLNPSLGTDPGDIDPGGIGLEVEEFFLKWAPGNSGFNLSAGKMLARIGFANQVHLSDFEFAIKPRVFSEYWGDNHGVYTEGLRASYLVQTGVLDLGFRLEASKTDLSETAMEVIPSMDLGLSIGNTNLGLKAFAKFDHQTEAHSFWNRLTADAHQAFIMEDGGGFNSFGGGLSIFHEYDAEKNLHFQTEWISRRFASQQYLGGYAFLKYTPSSSFRYGIMFQDLQLPALSQSGVVMENETSLVGNISYFPNDSQRIMVEYSHFPNSLFYGSMIMLKWTFVFNPK